jgi:hypothetical protein
MDTRGVGRGAGGSREDLNLPARPAEAMRTTAGYSPVRTLPPVERNGGMQAFAPARSRRERAGGATDDYHYDISFHVDNLCGSRATLRVPGHIPFIRLGFEQRVGYLLIKGVPVAGYRTPDATA